MSLTTITPTAAKRLIDEGAVLVDIRGPDEHARERIPGARNIPLDRITTIDSQARPVIFHCKSGNRTSVNSGQLVSATTCEAYVVAGGIESWKQAGLPVATDHHQPIEIMRQVQLIAGGLVLLGALAGAMIDSRFISLSALVGAGLMFAGATGWCGMAKLLAVMPWNRRHTAG